MLKRRTYPSQVVEYLHTCIREGTFAPGQAVREVEIAERLGISRAPVREALQVLVHEGLIDAEPQKGKKVRSLDSKTIADSFVVAGVLVATGVMTSFGKWGAADLHDLDSIVEEMDSLQGVVSSVARRKAAALDMAFHQCLLKHCNNQLLKKTAETACTPISKYLCYKQWLSLYSMQEFCNRHRVLATVMHSGDVLQISAAIRRHYDETGQRLAVAYNSAVDQ